MSDSAPHRPDAVTASGGSSQQEAPASVGSAYRLADGTLRLELRTECADGTIGEAVMIVPPDDPRHASILVHLGGLEPGRSRNIRPFPSAFDAQEDG